MIVVAVEFAGFGQYRQATDLELPAALLWVGLESDLQTAWAGYVFKTGSRGTADEHFLTVKGLTEDIRPFTHRRLPAAGEKRHGQRTRGEIPPL